MGFVCWAYFHSMAYNGNFNQSVENAGEAFVKGAIKEASSLKKKKKTKQNFNV